MSFGTGPYDHQMTTDEGTDLALDRGAHAADRPSFWHRGHPVFAPLAGFFTGTFLVVVVLGVLGLVLKALFDVDLSEHPGPFLVAILALFVLNVLLLLAPGTRRFARYMLFGLVVTPVVVGGASALTLYFLIKNDA